MLRRSVVGVAVCLVTGCATERTNPVPQGPFLSSKLEAVVPFATGGPGGITVQTSNNNLDVVVHDGRTFLAWRTAPSHFASALTELNVASEGPDGWRFEGKFSMGTDLREPRFLELNGKLFLFFAVLGTDYTKFEPQGMMETAYNGPNDWTTPQWNYLPGFIGWRAKVIDGKAYFVGYVGGENIYEFNGVPIDIHFLTTTDGTTLEPVVPGQPIVESGGGSETDFEFTDDGALIAVTRDEAGDAEFGFGSKICRAEANALGKWRCVPDRRKYDSPLVFKHAGTIYLVGRRNVSDDGNFDLGDTTKSLKDQAEEYTVDYSFKPKRCSLWTVDPDKLTVSFVLDFPSRGDTCFASYLPKNDNELTIYNYSTPLDGDDDCKAWPKDCNDLPWFVAQGRPTEIYRIGLGFPE